MVPFLQTRAQTARDRLETARHIAGKQGNPRMATKAGVIGLAKALGKEVLQKVSASMQSPLQWFTRKFWISLPRNKIAYMTDRISTRRTGKPEEIANVVHFLASSECSLVTGQCYEARGGRATY